VNSLHRVKVLGREVQVRSTASAELVHEVEDYVNCMIAELQESMKTPDQQIVTILALLNLAETLLVQTREHGRLTKVACERVADVIQHIDEVMNHP
jgi:cell division protein ZapA